MSQQRVGSDAEKCVRILLVPLRRLDELSAAGCALVEPREVFIGLMAATNLNPCETGCVYFMGGECPAYQKFHTGPKIEANQREASRLAASTDQSGLIGGKWAGMSIKQIAAKEGLSLNKVRENKRNGLYRE